MPLPPAAWRPLLREPLHMATPVDDQLVGVVTRHMECGDGESEKAKSAGLCGYLRKVCLPP